VQLGEESDTVVTSREGGKRNDGITHRVTKNLNVGQEQHLWSQAPSSLSLYCCNLQLKVESSITQSKQQHLPSNSQPQATSKHPSCRVCFSPVFQTTPSPFSAVRRCPPHPTSQPASQPTNQPTNQPTSPPVPERSGKMTDQGLGSLPVHCVK